ncbi:hypothetical protein [Chitinophaga sp. CF118]|uniref:hypothetical protein n=1 Tax=Chitinophaga sp. CF118 TaxID=1884367 RepID=UPI0011605E32|nr:hypothetical protein [Chitinophaga sp. CF118]
MIQVRFLPVLLGMLLLGANCVPPRHGPPRPPRPHRPPHGAVQLNIPDSSFQRPVVGLNY